MTLHGRRRCQNFNTRMTAEYFYALKPMLKTVFEDLINWLDRLKGLQNTRLYKIAPTLQRPSNVTAKNDNVVEENP